MRVKVLQSLMVALLLLLCTKTARKINSVKRVVLMTMAKVMYDI